MKSKRIIPCLDIRDGKVVKGVNFEGITTVGDPVQLAKKYNKAGADELVFLDITASTDGHDLLVDLIRKVVEVIEIPLIVGGGINSVEKAQAVIDAGASKVSIGSAAIRNPELITELVEALGKDKVIIAVDTKTVDDVDYVFVKGGKEQTKWKTIAWTKEVERLGAGEILLTSMNADGAQTGFALNITEEVSKAVRIPIIASGGAGSIEDFVKLFKNTRADAGLAASVFHYEKVDIKDLKQKLNLK